MAKQAHESFLPEGKFHMGLRAGGPILFMGQAKDGKITFKEETKNLQNYTGGGGLADTFNRISEVTLDLVLASVSSTNLAIATRGGLSVSAAGTMTADVRTAYPGGFLRTDGVAPTSVTVTVVPSKTHAVSTAYVLGDTIANTTHFYKCTAAGSTSGTAPTFPTNGTTVTDGTVVWLDMGIMALTATEYTVTGGGIEIPETAPKIAATGTSVSLDYSKTAGFCIEGMVDFSAEYTMYFDGVNAARGGLPFVAEFYRGKITAAKSLDLIGTDFTTLALSVAILEDTTKTGTGKSRYFKIVGVE